MKKRNQIIIVIVSLLAIVVILFIKSVFTVKYIGQQLLTIDSISDWSTNKNQPIEGMVNIGPGLYRELRSHTKELDKIEVKSHLCDCFGESIEVTHSIVMVTPKTDLCIRLRYDFILDKYHIVGYANLRK